MYRKIHRNSIQIVSKWFIPIFLLSLLLVSACGKEQGNPDTNQKTAIKVMYWDEPSYFNSFGDLFAMKYPHIEVEVVSTWELQKGGDSKQALEKFIEREQPDVLMLDSRQFEQLSPSGKLLELEPLIQRDQYDVDSIFPNLVELLKEKGEGRLYGLTPVFQGSVLYYNADLFTRYGVEFPHDGMTWQEVIDTARRFPVEGDENTRIYGFGDQYPLSWESLILTMNSTYGLKLQNEQTGKLSINTPAWKNIYQLALKGWESGAIYTERDSLSLGDGSMEDYYRRQLFLMGRIAMVVGDQSLLSRLDAARQNVRDIDVFEVGMVGGPVDPAAPEYTRDISLRGIYSIRADSPRVDAAWEWIKFINGEDYARIRSRTINNGLLSRMDYSKEFHGHSLEKFYMLKPKLGDGIIMYDAPPGVANELFKLSEREMMLVLDKKKTLDEALQTIESEGQAALEQAKSEQVRAAEEENDKKLD
ncbi:ABC transporter substrate-binding protein [Paenibacillus humicus]|uniref:ABC transporter substrate-binding protein n=1 Tax=Paenibacillus humicus TaxID=412861 RepID=UPI003D2A1333